VGSQQLTASTMARPLGLWLSASTNYAIASVINNVDEGL
jgi:hypothetical protein